MKTLHQQLSARLADAFAAVLNVPAGRIDPTVRLTADAKFGDYQSNAAMALAKTASNSPSPRGEGRGEGRVNPRQLAGQAVAAAKLDDLCLPPEIAGPGFINLRIRPEVLSRAVAEMVRDGGGSAGEPSDPLAPGEYTGGPPVYSPGAKWRLGVEAAEKPESIVIDFSSPNIAKEMHIGHLRSTVLGDALSRIAEFFGHQVHRQNHVGDWGTQFGMLLAYMTDREVAAGWKPADELPELRDLEDFYRKAKQQYDSDPDFALLASWNVVQLQSGERSALAGWQEYRDISLKHCQAMYDRLGVSLKPDHVRGESAYNADLPGVVADLKAKLEPLGLFRESEGAQCVFIEGFLNKEGHPLPFLVKKSDGGYLYATTDLAALHYRVNNPEFKVRVLSGCGTPASGVNRPALGPISPAEGGQITAEGGCATPPPSKAWPGPHRILYVVDSRQAHHFSYMFAVARKAGFAPEDVQLVYIPFGTIQGPDGKPFKTKSGESVKLNDVLDEAVSRARKIVDEKNADLPEAEKARVAEAVGVGAVKYFDLSNNRISDYRFDWDQMLALTGNTAPYLQYAYARVRSIFRKGGFPTDYADYADKRERESGKSAESVGKLAHPRELALALHLVRYGEYLAKVLDDYRPNILCEYLYELATRFSGFYEECPVLKADEPTRSERLVLCHLTSRVMAHGLGLLGIGVLEEM